MGYVTGPVSNNNAETISERAPWVALMMPQPIYTVNLGINGVGEVVQTGSAIGGASVTNPPPCVVTRGQSVTLVASGNFICWTGATNTTASNITIYPSQDTNITANFAGISSLAPVISVQPQSRTITRGSTLTLVPDGVGVPTPTFQWQFKGTNIGAGSALTIPNATVANQGNYQCVLSNPSGSVTSSVVAVSVTQPVRIPQPQIMSMSPNTDGTMSLVYYGSSGHTYEIQTSADLAQWTPVSTNTLTEAMNLFVDTNTSQNSSRYYRLKVVQ